DAYRSVYENALPILRHHNLQAAIFVPVGYLVTEDMKEFHEKRLLVKHGNGKSPLSWQQLRRLREMNWEIGSHSWSHPDFGRTGLDYNHELGDSRLELETRLGCPVDSFAFPFGKKRNFTEDAREAVLRTGYRFCFSGISGELTKTSGALPRTYVDPRWSVKL